jgi:acetolactate synthase-1/2/3 large subunit
MPAYSVPDDGDLVRLIARCFSEKGPCLLNVPVDREEEVYPMVPPGAANSIMLGGCHVEKCQA